MDIFQFLNQFHPLAKADYELIEQQLRPKSFKKGSQLLSPGDIQKDLYFVRSGIQMSYAETDHKAHVIAFTYAPGISAIPGSFSFQAPSRYHLTCLTDSELDCLSFKQLQELFDKAPPIERLFRKMTEMILAGMIDRHMELQILDMEERYRAFCKRSPHLLHQVPHKYIASYLGIDASNFSKLFNKVKIG